MDRRGVVLVVSILVCLVLTMSLVVITINSNQVIQTKNSEINALKSQIDSLNKTTTELRETLNKTYSEIEGLQNKFTEIKEKDYMLTQQVNDLTSIANVSQPAKLKTLVFHVCEKGERYGTNYHLPNIDDTYQQIQALNKGTYQILLLPEYKGDENWTETYQWIKANFTAIPLILPVFEGGNKTDGTPLLQLTINQISEAVSTCNVQGLRIAEMISWYMEHPNQIFPTEYVISVLEFAKTHGLMVQWGEWKVNSDVFSLIQNYTKGYNDTVTVTFQTNSGEREPLEGFTLIRDMFQSWGGGIQSWYWNSTCRGTETEMPISLLVQHALLAKNMGAALLQFEPYWYFFNNGQPEQSLKILMTMLTSTQPQQPLPLYEEITGIKNRLTINITEPNFTNPNRQCDFYELRVEDGENNQTTVNYWVFQHGQQEHGDIEAYVEIYNNPCNSSEYVVEIARNCWNELTVYLDGAVKTVFETITKDDMPAIGYITLRVMP